MANEITASATLVASKNGATVSASTSCRVDMTGDDLTQNTQVIGTSSEAIDFGEISGAPAYVLFKNLDSTNFVTVGFTDPPTEIDILAGQSALFPPATGTIYAIADTAAVRVLVVAAEA
jgi:hypothetical protein